MLDNAYEIMRELEKLGNENIKKIYLNHGAKEPLYGVTTKNLKLLSKKINKSYNLSMELYGTGNYDAMFLSGMISEPTKMTETDLKKWISQAYCHGISDYVVSITLAKSLFAQKLADEWINSGKELYESAGWFCYCFLISHKSDDFFDKEKIYGYLKRIENTIHNSYNRTRYAMNNFVITVGISYKPLFKEALDVARKIGKVYVNMKNTSCKTPIATEYIKKAVENNKIGIKKKYN